MGDREKMQLLVGLLLATSVLVMSFLVMTLGWGLTVQSWGWVIFGYMWMMVTPIIQAILND